MTCAAIILAGGSGQRAGSVSGGPLKQYRRIGGSTVIARVLNTFLNHPRIELVQVVLRSGTENEYAAAVAPHPCLLHYITGGARRQDSARLGLEALAAAAPEHVLIHDAARPFVSAALIDRILAGLKQYRAVVPGIKLPDTLKRVSPTGLIEGTLQRERIYAVQTPQGFRFAEILTAHRAAAETDLTFTDDAAVAQWNGLDVALVDGESANQKLTTAEDFALAEAISSRSEFRTGTGFDVHRFGPGDHVRLCGVSIPHAQGLVGHSDADVGLHAVTDALLGSFAEGDIGSHFPPSNPQWRNADSALFLANARERLEARGGRVVHVDVTLICEDPKVGPFRDAMRGRIAEILGIGTDRVAVKATTSEGLGFTGRGEGIAATSAVTVDLPPPE